MNETLGVIGNRRSVRKFSAAPISDDEKGLILHAAMRAPTAGNMMLYSILEIEDSSLKERLADTCDHQPFIASAPWVLLFVADYQRTTDYYSFCDIESACAEKRSVVRIPQEGDLLLACCDALIAAQNAVIAAESLGIGSCYIGDILENAEEHRRMFNLPQYTLPITLLVFGRPINAAVEGRLTTRFPQDTLVFKDRYRRLAPHEFMRMYSEAASRSKPDLPIEDAVKIFGRNNYFRKNAADFSIEMNRSAREWIRAWVEDNDNTSQ